MVHESQGSMTRGASLAYASGYDFPVRLKFRWQRRRNSFGVWGLCAISVVGFWLQVQEFEGFGLQGIHFGDLLKAVRSVARQHVGVAATRA
jgi:hypothetical protein